jgi:hypothetical protein
VDKILKKSKSGIQRGSSAWKQQIIDAYHMEKGRRKALL